MTRIDVKVTGPGGTIDYEIGLIKRALEQAGCKVEISSHCMGNPVKLKPLEDYHVGPFTFRTTKIYLEADHLPSGWADE